MLNERELWAAVVALAFEDLGDTITGYRTRLWFATDNYEPGSFLWICDHLELDVMSLRRAALGEAGAPAWSPSARSEWRTGESGVTRER